MEPETIKLTAIASGIVAVLGAAGVFASKIAWVKDIFVRHPDAAAVEIRKLEAEVTTTYLEALKSALHEVGELRAALTAASKEVYQLRVDIAKCKAAMREIGLDTGEYPHLTARPFSED